MKTSYETFEELQTDYKRELAELAKECDRYFTEADSLIQNAGDKFSEAAKLYTSKPWGVSLAIQANRCALECAKMENSFRNVSLTMYENFERIKNFKNAAYILAKEFGEDNARELVK